MLMFDKSNYIWGAIKCYVMISGEVFSSGYCSVSKIYGPTLFVLRLDGGGGVTFPVKSFM